jgi:hypothetical protein
MAVHHAATTPTPAGLEALTSLAVTVLNAHTDAAGLCSVCGCGWPCELVLLAGHNYDLAAVSCRMSWVGPATHPAGAAGPTPPTVGHDAYGGELAGLLKRVLAGDVGLLRWWMTASGRLS